MILCLKCVVHCVAAISARPEMLLSVALLTWLSDAGRSIQSLS